jgi:hypothetical protein
MSFTLGYDCCEHCECDPEEYTLHGQPCENETCPGSYPVVVAR